MRCFMKQLLEQYRNLSIDVCEKLQACMDLIQEKKAPDTALSEETADKLSRLREIYGTIVAKASETMKEPLQETSVDRLAELWEARQANARKQELMALLNKFVRVSSDEEKYRTAIAPSLEQARQCIAAFSDESADLLPLSAYRLVLKSIDGNELTEDEEDAVAEELRDPKIILGLQRSKYYLTDKGPETPDKPDQGPEPAIVQVNGPEIPDKPDQSPVSPPVVNPEPVKIPSKQQFESVMHKTFPVFCMLIRYLGCTQCACVDTITEYCQNHIIKDTDITACISTLTAKGYLAEYTYNGSRAVAFTELAHKCFVKYAALIRQIDGNKDKIYYPERFAPLTGEEVADFCNRARYINFAFTAKFSFISLFCIWSDKDRCHCGHFRINNAERTKYYMALYSGEGQTEVPDCEGTVLVINTSDHNPPVENLANRPGESYMLSRKGFSKMENGEWKLLISHTQTPGAGDTPADPVPEPVTPGPTPDPVTSEPEAEPVTPGPEPLPPISESVPPAPPKKPKPTAAPVPVPDETVEQKIRRFKDNALRAFEKGKYYAGMTILHGLEQESEDALIVTERFAYALGDPMLERDNRFSHLQAAFGDPFGSMFAYDTLAYCAYLRMYFSPSAGSDRYYPNKNSQVYLKDNLVFDRSASLNQIIFNLLNFVSENNRGLDDTLISAALGQEGKQSRIGLLSGDAQKLLDMKMYIPRKNHPRIVALRKDLFREGSDIDRLLKAIAADDRSQMEYVSTFVRPYLTENNYVVEINDESIQELLDTVWDKYSDTVSGNRNEQLTGGERCTLSNYLQEVFECAGEWLNEVDARRTVNELPVKAANKLMPVLREKTQSALKEISAVADKLKEPVDRAALRILEDTLKLLLDRMNGIGSQTAYRRDFYINLLQAPYVAVRDDRFPLIEERELQVKPFDFCEQASRYIDEPENKWEKVIERMFKPSKDRTCYDFGCARVLKSYLAEQGKEYLFDNYNIEKACGQWNSAEKKDLTSSPYYWERDFISHLEMAESDNWLSAFSTMKADILSIHEALYKTYFLAENYGFYGRATLRLTDYLESMASGLAPRYRERLEAVRFRQVNTDDLRPIFKAIEDAINKNRFGVADGYLTQAEQGNLDIVADRDSKEDTTPFSRFLDEYQRYLQEANEGKTGSLLPAYRQRHHDTESARYRSAVEMLGSWPSSDRKYSSGDLKTLLLNMGFEAGKDGNGVCVQTDKEHGFITAKIADPGYPSYPHPIGDFGSRLYEDAGLKIDVISGESTVDGLYNAIVSKLRFMKKSPVLFLINTAIDLDTRRQLAGRFASEVQIDPFIIMDRVCALYVAEFEQNNRWKYLLYCTLPFQPINPYYDEPSALIPPDMFFGRKEQLQQIVNTEVGLLVFGGRQLGKSALLHQAKNMYEAPTVQRFASFVDIKDKGVADAAQKIGNTLTHIDTERFLVTTKREKWTWKILMSALDERMQVKDTSFLLLIDEADTFLLDSRKHDYAELTDLVDLSTRTDNRFKFVMAGLHNVIRFSKNAIGNNSVLVKLKSLQVDPLSFEDARDLLEIPLRYLGYTFPAEDGDVIAQILHSTNYFPGLIHFYANRLIMDKHKQFNKLKMPGYELKRDDLLRLLQKEDFRAERFKRLMMTLKLDEKESGYYYTLALLLCALCYTSDDDARFRGVTVENLKNYLFEFDSDRESDISKLAEKSPNEIKKQLEELVNLYILHSETDDDGVVRYRFSRDMYIEMLGSRKEVEDNLVDALLKKEEA